MKKINKTMTKTEATAVLAFVPPKGADKPTHNTQPCIILEPGDDPHYTATVAVRFRDIQAEALALQEPLQDWEPTFGEDGKDEDGYTAEHYDTILETAIIGLDELVNLSEPPARVARVKVTCLHHRPMDNPRHATLELRDELQSILDTLQEKGIEDDWVDEVESAVGFLNEV